MAFLRALLPNLNDLPDAAKESLNRIMIDYVTQQPRGGVLDLDLQNGLKVEFQDNENVRREAQIQFDLFKTKTGLES